MAGFKVDSSGSADDIRYKGGVHSDLHSGDGRGGAAGKPPNRPGPSTASGHRGSPRWSLTIVVGLSLAAGLGVFGISKRDAELRQREEELNARASELARQQATLAGQEHRLQELQGQLDGRQQELAGREQSLDQRRVELNNRAAELAAKDDEQLRIGLMIDRRKLAASEIERAVDRLREEVELRERSLTEERALTEGLSRIDERITVVQESTPEPGWEQRARSDALAELVRAREELILRGAAESFRHEAAVAWELAFLKEIAGRFGLAEGIVPDNVFELLDSAALDQLEARWSAKLDQIRKRAAVAPGLYDLSLEQAETKLAEVRAAKEKRPADTSAQMVFKLLSAEVTEEVAAWLKARQSARDREIAAREEQLLAEDLARRRGNFSAHARLVELSLAPQTEQLRERVLARRQSQILERGRGLRPSSPLSNEVEELLKTRFTDPLRSVELESRLWLQWKANPGPHPTDFERWQVSQLTDAQLYELKQYYLLSLDRSKVIEQESPEGLQEYVKVDLATVTEGLDAINAEVAARSRERGPITIAVFAIRRPGEHGDGPAAPPEPPRPDGSPRRPEDQPRKPNGPGAGGLADVTFEFKPDDPHGKPDEPGEAGGVKGNGPRKPPPGGPSYDIADMPHEELLRSERIAAADLKADREYRTVYWERLRVHLARTGPDSEAQRLWSELSLLGSEDQIRTVEENRSKLSAFESRYRGYGGKAETVAAYREIAKAIDLTLARIQNGLDALITTSGDPARIQTLQARIKKNLGPNPPPTAEKADPYNDPHFVQTQAEFKDQLAAIQKEEGRARTKHDAMIAEQRRIERQKQLEIAAQRKEATRSWPEYGSRSNSALDPYFATLSTERLLELQRNPGLGIYHESIARILRERGRLDGGLSGS